MISFPSLKLGSQNQHICNRHQKNLNSLIRESQTDIITCYGEELQNTVCLWKYFWSQSEELPSTPHDTLKKVDENTFPLIYKILELLKLIPATAATFERANVRRRINVLMLLHIHNDLALNYDQVIDDFTRKIPKKCY